MFFILGGCLRRVNTHFQGSRLEKLLFWIQTRANAVTVVYVSALSDFLHTFISRSEVIPVMTSQAPCEGRCKRPSVNIATNVGEITSKSSTFWCRGTAYRHMPMLSSKYRRQRFSPRRALLDGSLPPGNSCRIRCFSKRYLTHLTEVSGITAASGGAVPVQVSRSTRIPAAVLSFSVADSADVLRGEGKLRWLCPRNERSVSLLTSRR